MHKGILRLAVVLLAALLNMAAAQASYYSGGFLGGKFGINNSTATGTIYDTGASTFAYGVQGGYLQGGYNWDVSTAIVGVGAYADFNSNEIHANKMEFGSRAFGLDAKLGVPVDEWLFYTKVGYGYSAGTNDLSAVSQYSSNVAVGLEYNFVFAFRWGAIVEYKLDSFSNRDGSISINNKTLAFGLNYYFDRPEVAPVAKVAEVELEPEPLPEADPGLEEEPPPDIGAGGYAIASADSTDAQDPDSWKILLAGNAVRIEGANFISGTASLMSVVTKELDETAGFAAKYPYAKLEVIGYSDGSAKQNLQLSFGRAEAIKKYLGTKGVAAKRISVKNKGAADPIGDNTTEEGRAKNRRIEIFSVIKVWNTLLENKPVIIENTNFVPGTAKLKPEVGIELDAVVGFAGKYPDAKLEMIGYSDTTNPALSLELADSVRNYLVTKGVADNRITIKGEGSAKPVGDNQTKEGRAKNRRVEAHLAIKEENKERIAAPAPAPAPTLMPPSKSSPTSTPPSVSAPAPAPATATALATTPATTLTSTPAQTSVPVSWKILLAEKPVLVNIEGTSFVSGSGTPNAKIGRNLDEVVGFAGKYPETKFELTGYADSRGSEKMNLELSLARAESIKAYLVKKGVAANRITTKGEGSAHPVGDNNTKEGRAKNRRVEIHSVIKEENKGLVAATAPVAVAATTTAISTISVPWKTLLENKPVSIESTNFVPGTIKLKPEAAVELGAVVGFAGKYPDAKLEIIGYSDTKANPVLSLGLADSVRNYLVTKGVAGSRITIKGAGSAHPVGDNNTKEGRAKNRRVEIHSVIKEENKGLVAATAPVAVAVAATTTAISTVPVPWKTLLENKPVSIESTNFVPGTIKLKPEAAVELDAVVGFAGKYPDAKLKIIGYSDTTDPALSLGLADSVRDYLVTKGVAGTRITIKGEGSAKPVGDNQTKEGRAKNRRVEIHSVIKEENKGLVAAPAPIPASAPAPTPQSTPEADSWKAFWPPNERRGR